MDGADSAGLRLAVFLFVTFVSLAPVCPFRDGARFWLIRHSGCCLDPTLVVLGSPLLSWFDSGRSRSRWCGAIDGWTARSWCGALVGVGWPG